MKAWEQREGKSIKGAVMCQTAVTWSPTVWSSALLAVTGVGLRWESFIKQGTVKAGAMWMKSNVMFLCHSEVQFFLFFFMLIHLSKSLSAHLYILTKKWSFSIQHHHIQHSHEHHHSCLVTAIAVWCLIGNLKWNLLLPSEATSACFSFSFLVVFWVFS